jgi:hypothetical protein
MITLERRLCISTGDGKVVYLDELEALREVAEMVRKAYNEDYDVPPFVIEALDKLDEARRG